MVETNEVKLDSPAMIEDLISKTLIEMGKIYEMGPDINLKNGAPNTFADGVDKQGLINTAEALECFFIPYFFVKGIREKFWKGELINLEHISESIKYIVKDYAYDEDKDNIDGKRKLSGTPYINFKFKADTDQLSGIERNMDFLDTACFVLSALLDAKAINYEKKYLIEEKIIDDVVDIIPENLMADVDKRIWDAAVLLKECDLGSGKGWSYTDDELEPKSERKDQLYFTWNALETMELLRIYIKKAPHLIPPEILADKYYSELKGIFREKQAYLSSTFLNPELSNLDISKRGEAIRFVEDPAGSYYLNLFALISLLLSEYKELDKLNLSLQTIIKDISLNDYKNYKSYKKEDYGEFSIAGSLEIKHDKKWRERAFICLFLKALALYKKLDKGNFDKMVKNVAFYKDKTGNNLLQDCTNILIIEKLPGRNVWDTQRNKYTIYYTERAIEALVRVYEVTSNVEIKEYYKQQVTSPVKSEEKFPSSAPIIQINLSEEIQKSIKNIIDTKVKETLADEKIVGKIAEQIKEAITKNVVIDEISSDKTIMPFFQYFSLYLKNARKGESEVDDNYKALKLFFTEIVGEIFIESFAHSLNIVGEKKKEKVEKDFSERFEAGLLYILDWENDPQQGVIDFGKTISKLRSEKFLEFVQKKTDKKK